MLCLTLAPWYLKTDLICFFVVPLALRESPQEARVDQTFCEMVGQAVTNSNAYPVRLLLVAPASTACLYVGTR